VAVREDEAEVVVVGFGGSGAAAAITAHDLGGEVVVLEAQPPESHWPQTKLLGGGGMFVADVERGAAYLTACADGFTPPSVCRAWAEKALDLFAWIEALDPEHYRLTDPAPSAEHPEFPGAETIVSSSGLRIDRDGGRSPVRGAHMFLALQAALERRGVPVRYGCRAKRLLQDAQGRVIGVEYEQAGKLRQVRAGRGVVLACGGFGSNEELKRQYLPAYPAFFYGNPEQPGDGVLMAQAVGAALWHMSLMMGRGVANFRLEDGRDLSVAVTLRPLDGPAGSVGYVITDQQGQRFANEAVQASMGHAFYMQMLAYGPHGERPRVPSYWFFDERRRRAGPICLAGYGSLAARGYDWSEDNSREIAEGWIAHGTTPAEAAAAAGVADPQAAARSIANYNQLCAAGGQDAFGRPAETLVPLDQGPFYCVPLWPGGTNTAGGPRRDEGGRIIHAFGHPIPGLFGAGELGLGMGAFYPGLSGYYSEVLCSGRIAGEGVMSERATG